MCILTGFFLSVSVYSYQGQSHYKYKQTKDFVSYVHNAAELLKNKGEEAFKDFSDEGSEWFRRNRYIFVYDLSGSNIFHPVTPELEGKNLIDMRDISRREYIIGSGLYNMRMEKQFIIDIVDSAVRLIKEKGTDAFNTFRFGNARTSHGSYSHFCYQFRCYSRFADNPYTPSDNKKVIRCRNIDYLRPEP